MSQNVFSPMSQSDLDWIVDSERELHAFPWTRGNFVDALASGYSSWVMRHDGEPAAYAVMLLVLDEAHLLNISVARAMQRRGLGTICLDYLFKQARLRGATQLFLEVRPSNAPALALYRRHGFVVVGRRKRYYPAPGGEREDAQVMRLELG
jgi:ribosomal-protein-alanine N-acetyltransferase